jgi:hypothetical protein
VSLWLDADHPGSEGARVRVSWEECGEPVEVAVLTPGSFALPPCGAPGDRRLVVELLNDATGPEGDRNLYVSLRAAP